MPDANRISLIRQNLSAIMAYAGQTATWRYYISASAGQAEYGQATSLYYVQRTITGVFADVKPQEVWMAGGKVLAGDLWLTTFAPLSERDEIQWAGGRYQVESEAVNVTLFGSAAGKSLIRRA